MNHGDNYYADEPYEEATAPALADAVDLPPPATACDTTDEYRRQNASWLYARFYEGSVLLRNPCAKFLLIMVAVAVGLALGSIVLDSMRGRRVDCAAAVLESGYVSDCMLDEIPTDGDVAFMRRAIARPTRAQLAVGAIRTHFRGSEVDVREATFSAQMRRLSNGVCMCGAVLGVSATAYDGAVYYSVRVGRGEGEAEYPLPDRPEVRAAYGEAKTFTVPATAYVSYSTAARDESAQLFSGPVVACFALCEQVERAM